MPNKKPPFPAARVKDPISVGLSIIVGGEDTVLIGGAAKPIACKDCKARELLASGSPVNTSYGMKLLPDEIHFALPAPQPFAWQAFYASDTPWVGLLGQGWRTPVEIHVEAGADHTKVIDIQGRTITFPELAPGEEDYSPSEHCWAARGSSDEAVSWTGIWQWLPTGHRHNPNAVIVTPGDGDYLVFLPAMPPPVPGAKTATADQPIHSGRYELSALINRAGYQTQFSWLNLSTAGGTSRVPEFIRDSAQRMVRLHYTLLKEDQRRHWDSHPHLSAGSDSGLRLTGLSLAYDPQRDEQAPADLNALRQQRTREWLVHYRYSEAGDLTEVRDGSAPAPPKSAYDLDDHEASDHSHWRRRFAYRAHLMTEQRSIDGPSVRYDYDRYVPEGKVTLQRQEQGLSYRYVYRDKDTIVTDSLERTTRYTFEGEAGLKRLVKLTLPDGAEIAMDYTNDGQLSRYTDPLGRQTSTQHNSRGEAVASVNALGHRSDTHLDPATGLVSAMRNPEGQSTGLVRDAIGNVTEVSGPDGSKTRYVYGHPQFPDKPTRIIDAKGGSKQLSYTNIGQLHSYTDCSGKTTRYAYDRKGQLTHSEDAEKKRTSYHRDAQGRVVRITHPDGREDLMGYDHAGRLTGYTDAAGQHVTLRYDRFGRVAEVRVLDGDKVISATHNQYDSAGRLVHLTNAQGAQMAFSYDPMDRLTTEIGFDGKKNLYEYNLGGELTAILEDHGGILPGDGTQSAPRRITLEHDPLGRLIARHIPDWTNNPGDSHRFAYNKIGQLTQAASRHCRIDYTYNRQARLVAEDWHVSRRDGEPLHSILRHDYDSLGNRTQTILPNGQRIDTLLYGAGHWHQVAWNGQALVDVERDDLHREIERRYAGPINPLSRLQSHTKQGQLQQTQLWRNQQCIEQHDYEYGVTGLLKRILQQSVPQHGQQNTQQPGAIVQRLTQYSFDRQDRLSGWAVRQGVRNTDKPVAAHPILQQASYAFDPAGNPIAPNAVARLHPLSTIPVYATSEQWDAQVKANIENPHFNLLGENPPRANRVDRFGAIHLGYDSPGNVTSRITAEGTHEFSYDALNQLRVSWFKPKGSNNPIQITGYFYDAFSRRIACVHYNDAGPNGEFDDAPIYTVRYLWDGDRMLQEIHDSYTRSIVYEPHSFVPLAQVIEENIKPPRPPALTELGNPHADGDLEGNLAWVAAMGKRMTQESVTAMLAQNVPPQARQMLMDLVRQQGPDASEQIHLFLPDHLGTPTRLIDAGTHDTLWEAQYEPWGGVIEENYWDGDEAIDADAMLKKHKLPEKFFSLQPIRFQGQWLDGQTGLYYNRYRYYDHGTRRYLTQDPIGLEGGMNFYRYAGNNPAMYVDPDGLQCIYHQGTGALSCTNAAGETYLSCAGYAGAGSGRNNPAAQNQAGVGPVPRGDYTVSQSFRHRHAGAATRRLEPASTNEMHGRAGFLIHGDNATHTASEGCIILPRSCRDRIPAGETVRVVE